MIERINLNSVVTQKKDPKTQPNFKGSTGAGLGLAGGVLMAIQALEANPMLNVTILDLATAILPRTYIESKTNTYAGLEAFRRESSGLLINCLIPGFIVWGLAKFGLAKHFIGGKTNMGSSWADSKTVNLVSEYWKKAEAKTNEEKAYITFDKILRDIHGVDGDIGNGGLKSFKSKEFDFKPSIEKFTSGIFDTKNKSKKELTQQFDKAYEAIVGQTHISENIKFGKPDAPFHSKNLKSTLKDTQQILKEFIEKGIHDPKAIDDFAKRSKHLINTKSLMGLGVIIPLAIMAQPINRWITAKTSGKKGAPIYKDYKDSKQKELSKEEKSGLLKQKFISVGSMVGVALLSMMKMPTMGMFQFKSLFPSMDQARLISTATFSSRMMASEDKNELREATVRDIATFSSFYFLGDYASKLAATIIEKFNKDVKLLNKLKPIAKDANIFKKFAHWVKDTVLKSSDELATPHAKRMRSVCQLFNIGFSLLLLGILIPSYTRGKTDKKHAEELKQKGVDPKVVDKYYPPFTMNTTQSATGGNTYKSFFTAK